MKITVVDKFFDVKYVCVPTVTGTPVVQGHKDSHPGEPITIIYYSKVFGCITILYFCYSF